MMRQVLFFPLLCFICLWSHVAIADVFAHVTVHRYATTERSYGANAYWLETNDSIVLIDALMLIPDAENLVTVLKSRKKTVSGIFLTHPHVDHFGGLSTLRRNFPNMSVFATKTAAEQVKKVHEEAYAQGWIQSFGADYDKQIVTPDHIVADGERLKLGSLNFIVHAYGPMESRDNIMIYSQEADALFTGDTVLNGQMYYLGEGFSAGTLTSLERISKQFPPLTRAYPGHGDTGRIGLMTAENIAQIRFMRDSFEAALKRPRAVMPEGRLADLARARLIGIFSQHFANRNTYGVGVDALVQMNISGLEKEYLAQPTPNKAASGQQH